MNFTLQQDTSTLKQCDTVSVSKGTQPVWSDSDRPTRSPQTGPAWSSHFSRMGLPTCCMMISETVRGMTPSHLRLPLAGICGTSTRESVALARDHLPVRYCAISDGGGGIYRITSASSNLNLLRYFQPLWQHSSEPEGRWSPCHRQWQWYHDRVRLGVSRRQRDGRGGLRIEGGGHSGSHVRTTMTATQGGAGTTGGTNVTVTAGSSSARSSSSVSLAAVLSLPLPLLMAGAWGPAQCCSLGPVSASAPASARVRVEVRRCHRRRAVCCAGLFRGSEARDAQQEAQRAVQRGMREFVQVRLLAAETALHCTASS